MIDLWIVENIAPVFYTMVELSIAACSIGLGVALVGKIADKKIPPFWKNTLWLLVLVALVIPYRPQCTTAVLPPVEVDFRQQELDLRLSQATVLEPGEVYVVPPEVVSQIDQYHAQSWAFEVIAPTIWLLGMAVMVAVLLVARRKMLKNLRTPNGRPYDVLLADCKRQLNITQTVEIVEETYLASPALCGLVRPKILLPDYVETLSQDSKRYILLHELCHLKGLDLWKNALLLTLQVVYWFNPLVWILFRLMRQDMELRNDERVLQILEQKEQTPYARSLVEVLGQANKLPLAPQMLCMVDDKDNTKRRIQMIQLGATFKRHRLVISIGCLVIIGLLSVLFLTAQPSIDWMESLALEDVSKMEVVTYDLGTTHIAYQPSQESKTQAVTLCNTFYGTQTQWEGIPTEEELRITIYAMGEPTHTLTLYVKEATKEVVLQVDGHYFLLDTDQTAAWLGFAETVRQDVAVVHDTYVYVDNHTYTWLVLCLEKDGTYSLSDSLDTTSGLHGAYTIEGNRLKLTEETTVQNCQYTFQIEGATLVLDLENSENLLYDIPNGGVFGAADRDVLRNGPESPVTSATSG